MKISQMVKAASGPSVLFKLLEEQRASLEKQLLAKLVRYLGPKAKHPQSRVVFANGYMSATVWIDMSADPQATQEEAKELATILLGSGAEIGPHVMVKGTWVATTKVDLRSLH